jgi:integrase/recombinase XerD
VIFERRFVSNKTTGAELKRLVQRICSCNARSGGQDTAGWLTERAVLGTVKRAAAAAGIEALVSPHWLRHAHASHAIDRGATLPEVQATLGHGNIAATSGYLHARPESSSGLKLDPGVFLP